MAQRRISLYQEVLPEDYLELEPGILIKNIPELVSTIKRMDNEAFAHHSSQYHNDIQDWILETYGDQKLVKSFGKITTRAKTIKFLEKALRLEKKDYGIAIDWRINPIQIPKSKSKALEALRRPYG